MRQLTHIPASVSRESVDAIRSRRLPPPPPGKLPDDGASWPCAPGAVVRIYEIEKEWSTAAWLCPDGRAQKEHEKWTVRSNRAPPFDDLRCEVHGDQPCPAVAVG